MSGTNKNLDLITGGPVIILVEPQLGENIGMVARAMANFGLSELRLVNPRDGWPSEKARAASSRAYHVIDAVEVYETLEDSIADLNRVMATTARPRDMIKTVLEPREAVELASSCVDEGQRVGILFGRERWGLENSEIALADEIVTFPVNPAFASLNIAQAVLLMAYEWMRLSETTNRQNFTKPKDIQNSPATRETLVAFLNHLEGALDDANYFFPPERRERMLVNLRSIFVHAGLQEAEVQSLHGVVAALERRWKKNKENNP